MATLNIIVPDESTNYVLNPALRYASTGWNLIGSTISRSTDKARFGVASLKIVTDGLAIYEGAYYRVNALLNISEPITASVYLRGSVGGEKVRLRLIDNPAGMEWKSKAVSLSKDRWMRISVTGRSTGTNDVRMYVESANLNSIKSLTFYADGAQIERKAYATTYVDGDQQGCRWNGRAHESSSTRSASERSGGRFVTLASPDLENESLYMTVVSGLGSAPISTISNQYSLLPGSAYQGYKVNDRVIMLTFHAKNENTKFCGNSLERLHELRQAIFDVVKPDRTAKTEFMYEYGDGVKLIRGKARYEAGLSGEWDVRNKFHNSFSLRLLGTSPMLFEDDQEVDVIDYQDNSIMNSIGGRVDGAWSRMNYGFDNDVYDLEVGPRKELIAAGAFTTANNSALAIDPLIGANRIAYWDGTKWVAFGAGANGTIYDIAVAPNGYIYVVGAFTSIGGVAANRVAYWNGSSWNAMGTGLNAEGRTISVAPNGHVFVGGLFTTAGGNNAYYIARWNGNAWYAMGANSGLNNYVYAIAISQNGNLLYAGGAFTDENSNPGSSLTRIAVYNIQSGTWDNMGNGFASTVRDIVISPSGTVYVGGEFVLSGSESILYIAQWNGSAWVGLGAGVNGIVYSITISPSGDLVAVGTFTQAGSVQARKIALWNGSTWVNMDIYIGQGSTGATLYAAQFLPNGDLFIGGTLFGTTYNSLYSGITLVNNIGTAQVSPKMYLKGSGTVRWIENQSTGKRVFLSLSILADEEVFIDFGAATVQSNIRGNLSYTIQQGSDFRGFTLLPGVNKIASFMDNDVVAYMQISYVPAHWSVDATAIAEVL